MSAAATDGPFPTPRQTLLLHAALGGDRASRAAWASFRAAGGGRLEDLDAASLRVLPQVYRNLEAAGVQDEATATLRGVYRRSWYRNQTLWRAAAPAVKGLQGAGLPVMVLKGAAITAIYPGGMGARPMNDVDLLVRPGDAGRAAEVLLGQGFREAADPPLAVARAVQHALPFRRGDGTEIDLHWHMLVQLDDDTEVWNRARSATLGAVRVLAPSATDQLLHTCVHGLSFCPAPTQWITDAVLIIRADDGIDWELLVAEASRRDVAVVMADALGFLHAEFGAPIPTAVIDALARAPATPTARLVHHFASGRPPLAHGKAYLEYWDSYRRRERMHGRRPTASGYAGFVADTWCLTRRRELIPELVRKAVEIARFGASAPAGTRPSASRPQGDPAR